MAVECIKLHSHIERTDPTKSVSISVYRRISRKQQQQQRRQKVGVGVGLMGGILAETLATRKLHRATVEPDQFGTEKIKVKRSEAIKTHFAWC